jgi:hypothetical protein
MTKWVTLFAVVALAGCGGGGGSTTTSTPNPQAATMQAGQWEFVATPNSAGAKPVYLEANFVLSPNQVTSTVFNTNLFQFGGAIGGQFSDCANWTTDAVVANGVLGGTLPDGVSGGTLQSPGSSGVEANFTATIASNGQSVSGGSYTDDATFCGLEPAKSSGTFTGYTVTPLDGTFSGTLIGTSAGADKITIQVTQDSNFGITATGTSVQNLVTTTLSIFPAGSSTDNIGGNSNVVGATVQANGTTSNVNGNSTFQVFGHINPAGTQIQVVSVGQSGTETGTLTKQ